MVVLLALLLAASPPAAASGAPVPPRAQAAPGDAAAVRGAAPIDAAPPGAAPLDSAPPEATPRATAPLEAASLSAPPVAAAARPAPPALPADAPLRTPAEASGRAQWTVPAVHTAGLLLGMRVALSAAWPRAYDPSRLHEEVRSLGEAYTHPPAFRRGVPLLESDGDPWLLNTVGHGLFGSEVYGRTRQCGHGPGASLAAAALASTAWEYGLEALHQRPSAIDLVWTPLAGALLGEARFQLHRWVRGQGEHVGPARRVLLIVLDPLGEAERGVLGTQC